MDIFDKAQDILDKAQERVADATTQAAWKANKAVRLKTAQRQKEEVEDQIGRTTMQLGNHVYQMWKNRSGRDEKLLEQLCHQLDSLLARYRDVNAELAEIDRSTYDGLAVGLRSAGPPGTVTVLPPAPQDIPEGRAVSPPPAPMPPQRRLDPPAAELPRPVTPAPAAETRLRPGAPAPTPPAAPQQATQTRPAARPKPCPSCGTTVPADMIYCPQCGYMAR